MDLSEWEEGFERLKKRVVTRSPMPSREYTPRSVANCIRVLHSKVADLTAENDHLKAQLAQESADLRHSRQLCEETAQQLDTAAAQRAEAERELAHTNAQLASHTQESEQMIRQLQEEALALRHALEKERYRAQQLEWQLSQTTAGERQFQESLSSLEFQNRHLQSQLVQAQSALKTMGEPSPRVNFRSHTPLSGSYAHNSARLQHVHSNPYTKRYV